MSSEIIVRPFQREDQDATLKVYQIGLKSYTSENSIPEVPPVTARFADARCEPGGDIHDIEASFMKDDPRKHFFVAVDRSNNKIVGCVGAIPSTEFDPNEYMELVRMSVDNSYRGAGIGVLLLNAFEEWARSNGYKKLNLTTLNEMKSAVRFYSKNGFALVPDKDLPLDLTKYGIVSHENSNVVKVVHFVKELH